ncbi:MAG: radical SAM protein [Candidatus Omnitrophota bacterium]|nr:radical SAM protein [Candidatus Omnitrophota bacterium]
MKDPEYTFKKPIFSLQWHLTTACQNSCKHCYMDRSNETLSYEDCEKVVDDFQHLLTKWKAEGRVYLTGGDPLLFPYFFEIFKYLKNVLSKDTKIGILGNPELLDEKILSMLAALKPFYYQLSLDGLEKNHDFIRHPGSFASTLNAIKLLQSVGIKVAIMFTVSRVNIKDLPSVVDLVAEMGIRFFDFARYAPISEKDTIKSQDWLISPLEYRKTLYRIAERYEYHKNNSSCVTAFGYKEPLWALVDWERGKLNKITSPEYRDLIIGGCNIGATALSILHDGSVLGCRRIPKTIGKVPEEKLTDIFIHSCALNEMRDIYKIKKCNKCELLLYCRGCRAIPFSYYKDFFAPDPQCWK